MNPRTFARFWSKVQIGAPEECWPYTGGKDWDGYGIFSEGRPGKSVRAHRYAFHCANGRNAKPMALHRCHNRACCNPLHLYEGTALDNMTDCIEAGNYVTIYVPGEKHRNAKLTDVQVAEIRRLRAMGHKQREVAERFGVTASLISMYENKRLSR